MPNVNNGILEQLLEQNPLAKSGLKKVQKIQDQQIEEAMQQGVPAEHILAQMLKPKSAFDPGGIEQGQQGEVTGIRQPGWVSRIGQAGLQAQGINAQSTPDELLKQLFNVAQIQGQQTETQLGQQELAGEKPLQKGRREELGIMDAIELQKEVIKQAQEGLLKPNEIFTKFETASQPFIIVRDAYARMLSLAGNPSPAGDLGYIFSYMKLLDPPSTIREGEQATAANASAVPDRIKNIYNRVIRGQKLTPQQREDFKNRATQLFKSIETQQKKTTEEFSNLAVRNNLDPKTMIRDT